MFKKVSTLEWIFWAVFLGSSAAMILQAYILQ